jgi:hypothetical protein
MEKTYTGKLREAYFAPKKFINVLGYKILFIEGVSKEIPQEAALNLLNKGILFSITENINNDVLEVEPVALEDKVEVTERPELPELPELVKLETLLPELPEVDVSDASTDTDEYITKELIELLYEEHKTWSAVSDYLGISSAKLKKYREDFGI